MLVTSDPLSVNADGDAYLDSQEKIYGFNPNVPSSGDILSLESEIVNGSNVILPGGTLQYHVTLANQLKTNRALGLLDVDFDAAVSNETVLPKPFNLSPGASESSQGSVTVAGVAQSQAISLTNVAGALVVSDLEAVGGRSLWLKFDEPNRFVDDSLNNWTVSCTSCPPVNSGYRREGVSFRGNLNPGSRDTIVLPDGAQDIGMNANGFTADFWLAPTYGLADNVFNLFVTGDIKLQFVNGILKLWDGTQSWKTAGQCRIAGQMATYHVAL